MHSKKQLFIADDETMSISIFGMQLQKTEQAHHFLVQTWRMNKLDVVQGF